MGDSWEDVINHWYSSMKCLAAQLREARDDRDVAALKAERTDLLAKNKDLQELARVAMVEKAKLAATVERVKALPVHYAHGNPVVTKAALDLALAQPVKREERRKGEECLDSTKTTFHHESPQGYCTFGPDRRRAGSGE